MGSRFFCPARAPMKFLAVMIGISRGLWKLFWFSGLPSSVGLMTDPLWKFYNPALKERFKNRSRNFFISTSGANLAMLSEILLDDGQFSALVNSFDSFENSLVHTSPSSLMNADLVRYLPDNILALTDKATMSASVECRVPFWITELLSSQMHCLTWSRFRISNERAC